MKVNNIENPKEFMELVDECVGKVELITADGDRLNLKSKLCQYVSLVSIFTSASQIPSLEIIAHEAEDRKKIMDYMMKG